MIPDAALDALVRAVRDDAGANSAEQPPAMPSAGQTQEQWRAQVAEARSAADAHALAHRERVDRLSQQLFETTASALLPSVTTSLTRTEVFVPVPPDPQLARDDGAPYGPGARALDDGTPVVRVAVTAPPGATRAILRLHGGAFWMGGGEAGDSIDKTLIDQLAAGANAAVLNVDYRLAPEHPFPASIVDALCVLDALRQGAFGIDARAVATVGTSSGANVATALAKVCAGRGETLDALALIVPSVLISSLPDSLRQDAGARQVRMRQLRGYLGTELDAADPWVSLANTPALAGFPPTFAAVAAQDEIALGGHELCAAIIAGGGRAVARDYPMTHTIAPPTVEAQMITDVVAFLRDELDRAEQHREVTGR